VFLVDWDDTLMPTSWLQSYKLTEGKSIKDLNCTMRNRMQHLRRESEELLRQCSRYGDVIIVTNGSKQWVDHSVRSFFPGFEFSCVPVYSARDAHENGERPPLHWKARAMRELLRGKRNVRGVVSIGDSPVDLHAARMAIQHRPECVVKLMKLRREPTPLAMTRQLVTLRAQLEPFLSAEHNLWVADGRCFEKVAEEVRRTPLGSEF